MQASMSITSITPAFQSQKQLQQLQGASPFGNSASQQHLVQPQVLAAAAQARHQQLDLQLAQQSVENLLRYQNQFHAHHLDLDHKICSVTTLAGLDGAPVVANTNEEIEDAVRQLQNNLFRCMNMEQTI